MKYVALLRGINVGGTSKVAMSDLKVSFAKLGFENITTYINSGNVMFTTPDIPDIPAIEHALSRDFALPLRIVVRDSQNLQNLVDQIPTDWVNDKVMKCDVMFLWPEVDGSHVLEQLTIKPDLDTVMYIPGAVVWRVDRNNVSRSGLLKIIGTPLYKQMTIRNINTVRKLAALL